ncbi:MAG: dephospho-CoA kinase [Opitutae bacterium]|nr:dephospho-CoA kinase [Opitutae bacterium]
MRIALSGGIGCGKSAALEIFKARNFPTFSADACARELLASPQTVWFVAENFGAECVENSTIRRDKLAAIVFSDNNARRRLENFLHPKIEKAWREFCSAAEGAGKIPVVEIPLLFEKNYDAEFDITICVACSRETQLSRLEKRGVGAADAERRMVAQLPLENKIARANILLSNDGSLEFLEAQIDLLCPKLSHQN